VSTNETTEQIEWRIKLTEEQFYLAELESIERKIRLMEEKKKLLQMMRISIMHELENKSDEK
jgi:predicted metalloprotease